MIVRSGALSYKAHSLEAILNYQLRRTSYRPNIVKKIKLPSQILKKSFQSQGMATLETLRFDNLSIRKLPLDPEEENYVRTVRNSCFSVVKPTPVDNPTTVAYSSSAFALLDLAETELNRKHFSEYFSGNKLLIGSQPFAHCYCGHQFGYFSGQLGDGAAMYLGEVINHKGERWELQLKGAGKTPYSRQADGRKVLRSSIREFLCSEAMHHLGIPTTRACSCITSDSKVIRDVFYDGHPIAERCTIISRIAPTFLRFGSFEIFKTLDKFTGRVGPSIGRNDILLQMLNHSIETFFPEIHSAENTQEEKYKSFFKEVVLSTARLVACWQCVGFCHGVLNTDNMSIVGITIDYGPFGFLDSYDADHICNASDDGGRYTFIKQPEICLWNLQKFAEAIQGALSLSESLPLLQYYYPAFEQHYLSKMRKKLGLLKVKDEKDKELISSLLDTMGETAADFTNSFRCLSCLKLPGLDNHEQSFLEVKEKLLQQCYPLEVLIRANQCSNDGREFQLLMLLMQSNPELLEQLGKGPQAMERIKAKMKRSETLQKLTPEGKRGNDEKLWTEWLMKYKERLQKEICDIDNKETFNQLQLEREIVMNNNNPRFILRNYIAENAISHAEKGCFEEVRKVLRLLENPYANDAKFSDLLSTENTNIPTKEEASQGTSRCRSSYAETCYDEKSPDWAMSLKVT